MEINPLNQNPPKLEHLNKETKPLNFEVGDIDSFSKLLGELENPETKRNYLNVSWSGSSEYFRKNEILGAGDGSYAISPINDSDKYSEELTVCTCLIVVGKDKNSNKEISLLTHQNPHDITGNLKGKFFGDLEKRLNEMKINCFEGSIDAVMAGGENTGPNSITNNFLKMSGKNISDGEIYENSIELIFKKVEEILGFKPLIIDEPKKQSTLKGETVILKTKERKVYLIKPLRYKKV